MSNSRIDVTYEGPLWSVCVAEERVVRSRHDTKASAVDAARCLASQLGAELVVHDLDGSVLSTEVFGRCLL
jgi:hypothetical protein